MKLTLNWIEGMEFEAESDDHNVLIDAKSPIGKNKAMTPKELVVVGLGGCTAMDVIALLKKHHQNHEKFNVEVETLSSTGVHPSVFTEGTVIFNLTGNVDKNIYLEAVRLSQTKYCGVSKMLSKAFPIKYIVKLNNEIIGEGKAEFENS
jgi:putative redox protein